MKFEKKYDIAPAYENLFAFNSKEEELEHQAKMIMFRFLSEMQKVIGDKILKKKDLAQCLQTSGSYITQLYRGDKLLNLITLAKIEDVYNLTFEINAKLNCEDYSKSVEHKLETTFPTEKLRTKEGYWLFINTKPEYANSDIDNSTNNKSISSLKIA